MDSRERVIEEVRAAFAAAMLTDKYNLAMQKMIRTRHVVLNGVTELSMGDITKVLDDLKNNPLDKTYRGTK